MPENPIDPKTGFLCLLDVMKQATEHFHKLMRLYVSIEAALITAVAALLTWSEPEKALRIGIILVFSLFAILVSIIITHAMSRNRKYYSVYVDEAIKIQGDNPYIWKADPPVPGLSLGTYIKVINRVVVFCWTVFSLLFLNSSFSFINTAPIPLIVIVGALTCVLVALVFYDIGKTVGKSESNIKGNTTSNSGVQKSRAR